jgi:hypothetical protein
MAVHGGLVFGREAIFTYGPLGYLAIPTLWYQDLGVEAVVYSSIVHIAACLLVLWAATRVFDRLLATIVAIVACSFLGPPLVVIALLLAAAQISGWAGRRLDRGFPILLGCLAAFAFLVKINYGVEILAVGAVALFTVEWRRVPLRLAEYAAAFVFALILLWLLAGQPLGALPDYLSSALQTVSGYSQAMVLSEPSSARNILLAIGLGAAATTAAWVLNADLEQRRRIVLTGLIALFSFLSFKEGFVRQDGGHVALFASAMVCTWFVLGWRRPLAWPGLVSLAAVLAVAANLQPASLDPIERARSARNLAQTILDPARRHSQTDFGRALILTYRAVDPAIVDAIGDTPVQVGPYEISVAWALGLDWHPLPVFQDYSAYTPSLDKANAEALRGPDRPELILRHPSNGLVDGRFTAFDPPEATISMLCNYSPDLVRGNWMLLRGTRNRCGVAHPLGQESAEFGEPLRVPPAPPGQLVIARLHGVQVSGAEQVRSLLFRSRPRYISFINGSAAASAQVNFRLVPATAGDGLLMSAPAAADYPGLFALAPNPTAFIITAPGIDGTVEASFYSIPIEPPPKVRPLGSESNVRKGADPHGAA